MGGSRPWPICVGSPKGAWQAPGSAHSSQKTGSQGTVGRAPRNSGQRQPRHSCPTFPANASGGRGRKGKQRPAPTAGPTSCPCSGCGHRWPGSGEAQLGAGSGVLQGEPGAQPPAPPRADSPPPHGMNGTHSSWGPSRSVGPKRPQALENCVTLFRGKVRGQVGLVSRGRRKAADETSSQAGEFGASFWR